MESFDNDRRSESDHEYEVGYRRPPRHSRFKKGQSGNARGKTRGTKSIATLFKQALLATVPVIQNGRQTKPTKLWFILAQLINQAVRGQYASIRLVLRYSGLDRRLSEPERESQGISPQNRELLRRAQLGDKPEVFAAREFENEPASTHPLPLGQLQSSEESLGQSYSVGYRKPPKHTRFEKGRSGNPFGRPKAPKSIRTTILRLLDEKIPLTENGEQRLLSRLQIIFIQIVNRAAKQDLKFQALLLEYAPTVDFELRRLDPRTLERAKVLVRGTLH
jgi:hypothetical protein